MFDVITHRSHRLSLTELPALLNANRQTFAA